jgi:beta-mannosidase
VVTGSRPITFTGLSLSRYRNWLTLATHGGQNIFHDLGGGVYEYDEAFYDAADESGLTIWRGPTFACGAYPAHDELVESVRGEAREAVRRLR